MSPEKTHKRHEGPHQAVRRERRQTRQALSRVPKVFSEQVLERVRVDVARELIVGPVWVDKEILEMVASSPRLALDITRA